MTSFPILGAIFGCGINIFSFDPSSSELCNIRKINKWIRRSLFWSTSPMSISSGWLEVCSTGGAIFVTMMPLLSARASFLTGATSSSECSSTTSCPYFSIRSWWIRRAPSSSTWTGRGKFPAKFKILNPTASPSGQFKNLALQRKSRRFPRQQNRANRFEHTSIFLSQLLEALSASNVLHVSPILLDISPSK